MNGLITLKANPSIPAFLQQCLGFRVYNNWSLKPKIAGDHPQALLLKDFGASKLDIHVYMYIYIRVCVHIYICMYTAY